MKKRTIFLLLLFLVNLISSEFITIVPDPNKIISKNITNSYIGKRQEKLKKKKSGSWKKEQGLMLKNEGKIFNSRIIARNIKPMFVIKNYRNVIEEVFKKIFLINF